MAPIGNIGENILCVSVNVCAKQKIFAWDYSTHGFHRYIVVRYVMLVYYKIVVYNQSNIINGKNKKKHLKYAFMTFHK